MSIMVCKSCTRHIDTDFEEMDGEECQRCSEETQFEYDLSDRESEEIQS